MTIKLRTFPNDDLENLESQINAILAKPESAGFSLVAVCPAPDGASLLLFFQKST